MEQLRAYVTAKIKEHPDLKSEIMDFYQLCLDEIESGESEDHEIQLCYQSIDELFE